MGLIRKLFKRDLTPEQQAEQSRKEKEWMDKCHQKGEEFARRLSLDKGVEAVNNFANTYPRTFFAILFGVLFLFIGLNMLFSGGDGTDIGQEIDHIEQLTIPDGQNDARDRIMDEAMKMDRELKDIDRRIEAIMARDTLTREDSLELKKLLIRADAVQKLLTGKGILPQTDSNNNQ